MKRTTANNVTQWGDEAEHREIWWDVSASSPEAQALAELYPSTVHDILEYLRLR